MSDEVHCFKNSDISLNERIDNRRQVTCFCVANLAHMTPKRIVYVSCNPASLARDIAILSEFGYVAKKFQTVDMFSEASYIECVVLLEKK